MHTHTHACIQLCLDWRTNSQINHEWDKCAEFQLAKTHVLDNGIFIFWIWALRAVFRTMFSKLESFKIFFSTSVFSYFLLLHPLTNSWSFVCTENLEHSVRRSTAESCGCWMRYAALLLLHFLVLLDPTLLLIHYHYHCQQTTTAATRTICTRLSNTETRRAFVHFFTLLHQP